MSRKIFISGLLLISTISFVQAQKIVVDSTFSNKYLVEKEETEQVENQDLDFSDRALSIGKGILNRLKARLNLEEAAESLKNKKEQYFGKKEEEEMREETQTGG